MRRSASVFAAFALLAGCTALRSSVELATPRNDLPDLVLPDSLRNSLEKPSAYAYDQPSVPTTQASMTTAATTTATPEPTTVLSATPQPNAYALVIGIEDYRDVPPVPGAEQDASRIVEVLRTTLGLPENNIVLATGNPGLAATLGGEWVYWHAGRVDIRTLDGMAPFVGLALLAGWAVIIGLAGLVMWRSRAPKSS